MSKRITIGGGDASAILGINPYLTNVDLWKIKTGRLAKPDISNKPEVIEGKAKESILIDFFECDNQQYEIIRQKPYPQNLVYSKEHDWMVASLDGELINKNANEKGVLEIKTSKINRNADEWKEKIPDNYLCQVLHYLMITQYSFAVLFASLKYDFKDINYSKLVSYYLTYEDRKEEIEYLKNKEIEFWNEYILKDREPSLILPQI